MSCCTPTNPSGASGLSGAWPGCAPTIWPRSPTFPPPARWRAYGPRNLRTGKHSGSWSRIWICSFMTSSTWTGPPAAHGRVQPADSGQPARAVPHGQKGSDPNAAAPRPERRSRRAGGGFRHTAGGSGTSRAWNCCPNRYGEGKYRQLGQATLAENPIRRSVWRDSRPFSRPGARRD